MYYIYKIENLINGKKYIGLTNNIQRRRSRHFTDLKTGKHNNHFLQKEYNIYGAKNFSFEIEFEGNVSYEEISQLEKDFILKYDSYKNGYNQNEGGNFGPSNGGSTLTESDILNILSALEFMPKPGQALADIYNVSRTTISRIKNGINHCEYVKKYKSLSDKDRYDIYQIFYNSSNLYEKKVNSTIIKSKRHLNEQQVHLVLLNFEKKIIPITQMAKRLGIKSTYTLDCIRKGKTYKNFALTYTKLNDEQKNSLASLLSNK